MEDDGGMGETPCDLTKPKDRSIHKYLDTFSKYGILVPCKKLPQERGLQFYQTRSHAIVLYGTLPAVCIEKAVCMKTKEELKAGWDSSVSGRLKRFKIDAGVG